MSGKVGASEDRGVGIVPSEPLHVEGRDGFRPAVETEVRAAWAAIGELGSAATAADAAVGAAGGVGAAAAGVADPGRRSIRAAKGLLEELVK